MTATKPTRRSILTMLGFAPIAAPALAAAAAQPAAVRFVGGSTQFLAKGSRLLVADEVDACWGTAEVAAYSQSKLIIWPDGPEKDQVNRDWAEFMRQRMERTETAREAVRTSHAPGLFLIDDVGSGP